MNRSLYLFLILEEASFSWHTIQHNRIQFQEESVAVPKAKDNPCTYADYAAWPEGERWELIEGVPCDMSPAPKHRHQDILPVEVLESSIEMAWVLNKSIVRNAL